MFRVACKHGSLFAFMAHRNTQEQLMIIHDFSDKPPHAEEIHAAHSAADIALSYIAFLLSLSVVIKRSGRWCEVVKLPEQSWPMAARAFLMQARPAGRACQYWADYNESGPP